MKKAQDGAILRDAYHSIKSPIVSIKSMLFVLGRNKEIKDNKNLVYKISQIDGKVNLLHSRVELFLNYFLFKEGDIEFLYSFFNLSELISSIIKKINAGGKVLVVSNTVPKDVSIMADHDQIQDALYILFEQSIHGVGSSKVAVSVSEAGRKIIITLVLKQSPNDPGNENKDVQTVEQQRSFIAGKIIELHGGTVNRSRTKIVITLLKKAKAGK